MTTNSVKITAANQITIPSAVRKKLNIKKGDCLLVDVQDGLIVLIPESKYCINHLQGLHNKIWKDIDVQGYLDGERNAWMNSDE